MALRSWPKRSCSEMPSRAEAIAARSQLKLTRRPSESARYTVEPVPPSAPGCPRPRVRALPSSDAARSRLRIWLVAAAVRDSVRIDLHSAALAMPSAVCRAFFSTAAAYSAEVEARLVRSSSLCAAARTASASAWASRLMLASKKARPASSSSAAARADDSWRASSHAACSVDVLCSLVFSSTPPITASVAAASSASADARATASSRLASRSCARAAASAR
eukprot:scaffold32765_cov34-Phaeocystis_antarctica.AAC.1